MEQIGHSLVDSNGVEVRHWGGTMGRCEGVPDRIDLPTGDFVHGAKVGDEFQGYRLVPRLAQYGNFFGVEYDGTSTVITFPWPDLASEKRRLSALIDEDAGRIRARYLSTGVGMEMTYQEKHAQARAVVAIGQPAADALTEAERDDQFPTLSASVGIEASTLFQCATLVIARYEAFADLSRVIERTRLAGKKAISDASDVASARAAYEAITWTI